MNDGEWVGYFASLLVLATFCMRDMVALRAVAIASNVAFIAYAAVAGIAPVLVLHALLLPMNVLRLMQSLATQRFRAMTARHVTVSGAANELPGAR